MTSVQYDALGMRAAEQLDVMLPYLAEDPWASVGVGFDSLNLGHKPGDTIRRPYGMST